MVPGISSSRLGVSSSPLARQQAEAIRQRAQKRADAAAQDASMELEPKNVMETLVAEEIDDQLQHLSPKEQKLVKVPQVMAFALNRLPGLYVTSEKGWRNQWGQGKSNLQAEVKQAVRHGIIAVQRDPLRAMSTLSAHPPDAAEAALGQLRKLLQNQHLTWHNLVPLIQKLLVEGKMNFPDSLDEVELETALNAAEMGESPSRSVDRICTDEDEFDWDSAPIHQRR
jgi:hypothetical protein